MADAGLKPVYLITGMTGPRSRPRSSGSAPLRAEATEIVSGTSRCSAHERRGQHRVWARAPAAGISGARAHACRCRILPDHERPVAIARGNLRRRTAAGGAGAIVASPIRWSCCWMNHCPRSTTRRRRTSSTTCAPGMPRTASRSLRHAHAPRGLRARGKPRLLDGGRVAATGTPHEILDSPASEPLARLAGFENLFSGVIVEPRPDAGTMRCRLTEPTGAGVEMKRRSPTEHPAIASASPSARVTFSSPSKSREARRENILRGQLLSLTARVRRSCVVDAGARFQVDLTPGARDDLRLGAGEGLADHRKGHSFRMVSHDTIRGDSVTARKG